MNESSKVVVREALVSELAGRRSRGERIVFTNGCFDLLHVGHARYLAAAKALGDCLIVGVNSDASVRALKGRGRPLMCEDDRTELLASLACVDFVTLFAEDTPVETLLLFTPDIHVKGGDYTPEELPEAPTVQSYGGRIEIMPLVEGRSTTNLIARILAAYGPT